MSDKIVITRELAAEIESLRALGRSDQYFLDVRNFLTEANRPSFPQNIPGGVIAAFLSENITDNLPLYAKVIVNGYTVEETPEDKVREYYESNRGQGEYGGITTEAIRETLNLLGIKIKGVNA